MVHGRIRLPASLRLPRLLKTAGPQEATLGAQVDPIRKLVRAWNGPISNLPRLELFRALRKAEEREPFGPSDGENI